MTVCSTSVHFATRARNSGHGRHADFPRTWHVAHTLTHRRLRANPAPEWDETGDSLYQFATVIGIHISTIKIDIADNHARAVKTVGNHTRKLRP